jgi:ribosomal protein L29
MIQPKDVKDMSKGELANEVEILRKELKKKDL